MPEYHLYQPPEIEVIRSGQSLITAKHYLPKTNDAEVITEITANLQYLGFFPRENRFDGSAQQE
jgi:hypothetical protein